jgi:hypothetical protein
MPPGTATPAALVFAIALWFPAPPAGTRTVAVDVPDRFRITDVPIN